MMELMTMSIFGTILGSFRGSFRDHVGDRFLTSFWLPFNSILTPFWHHFESQIGSGRAKTALGEASRASKAAKRCLSKNLKKLTVFLSFWGPEASQERLRKPQKAPKRHLKSSKIAKKVIKQMMCFETVF